MFVTCSSIKIPRIAFAFYSLCLPLACIYSCCISFFMSAHCVCTFVPNWTENWFVSCVQQRKSHKEHGFPYRTSFIVLVLDTFCTEYICAMLTLMITGLWTQTLRYGESILWKRIRNEMKLKELKWRAIKLHIGNFRVRMCVWQTQSNWIKLSNLFAVLLDLRMRISKLFLHSFNVFMSNSQWLWLLICPSSRGCICVSTDGWVDESFPSPPIAIA